MKCAACNALFDEPTSKPAADELVTCDFDALRREAMDLSLTYSIGGRNDGNVQGVPRASLPIN